MVTSGWNRPPIACMNHPPTSGTRHVGFGVETRCWRKKVVGGDYFIPCFRFEALDQAHGQKHLGEIMALTGWCLCQMKWLMIRGHRVARPVPRGLFASHKQENFTHTLLPGD